MTIPQIRVNIIMGILTAESAFLLLIGDPTDLYGLTRAQIEILGTAKICTSRTVRNIFPGLGMSIETISINLPTISNANPSFSKKCP